MSSMDLLFHQTVGLMEGDSIQGCIQALALLAAQYTPAEFAQRVMVFLQLHQHWSLKHSVQVICLTCQKDVTSEPVNSFLAKTIMEPSANKLKHVCDFEEALQSAECGVKSAYTDMGKELCSEPVKISSSPVNLVCSSSSRKNLSETEVHDDHSKFQVPGGKHKKFKTMTAHIRRNDGSRLHNDNKSATNYNEDSKSATSSIITLPSSTSELITERLGTPNVGAKDGVEMRDDTTGASRTKNRSADYMCSYCGRLFRLRQLHAAHVLTHTGERPYECRHAGCAKRFGQRSTRNFHERTHSDNRPHVCSNCGLGFKHPSSLKTHVKNVHSEELVRSVACDQCGKMFKLLSSLWRHAKYSHSDERSAACDFCPKRFKDRRQLARHKLALHSGQKPWKCTVCDKTFTQAGNMRTHLRTHTGEKPYTCGVCGSSFRHSGTLKGHLMSHTHTDGVL